MTEVGKKIFYELDTGYVLITTPSMRGEEVSPRTADEFIQFYPVLRERDRASFGVVELEYGEKDQDFAESERWQVDPSDGQLIFTYLDPNNPEVPQVPQPPLSERIESLKQENALLKAQNNALAERADFIEDVIAEMAARVYQ